MKKHLTVVFIAGIFCITSCSSSSLEDDVKKMANYRCEIKHLMNDPAEDAQKKLVKVRKEMEAFGEKMQKKYDSKRNDTAWANKGDRMLDEELAKCK